MSRLRARHWLLALAAGAVLLVLALMNLDDATLHRALVSRVEAATGRSFVIAGDLELEYWPKLHVRLSDARLGNAPGFGDEPLLRVAQLDLALALSPLLRGELEFDTLKIRGLEAHLVRQRDGRTNWRFDERPREGDENSTLSGLAAFALGGVDLRDTRIFWEDEVSDQHLAAENLNLQIAPLAYGEPVDFKLEAELAAGETGVSGNFSGSGTARYFPAQKRYTLDPVALSARLRGKRLPGGEAQITARTRLRIDPERGRFSLRGLEIDGLGIRLRAEAKLDHLREAAPGGAVDLSLEARDLAPLLQVLGLPAADRVARLPARGVSAKVQGSLDRKSGLLSVPELQGKVLGLTFKSALKGTGFDTAAPLLSGTLQTSTPDLPNLLLAVHAFRHPHGSGQALERGLRPLGQRGLRLEVAASYASETRRLTISKLVSEALDSSLTANLEAAPGEQESRGGLQFVSRNLAPLLLVRAAFTGEDDESLKRLAALLATRKSRTGRLEAKVTRDALSGRHVLEGATGELLGNTVQMQGLWSQSESGAVEGQVSLDSGGEDFPAFLTLAGAVGGASGALTRVAEKLPARAFDWHFKVGARGRKEALSLTPLEAALDLPAFQQSPAFKLAVQAAPVHLDVTKGQITAEKIELKGPGFWVKGSVAGGGAKALEMHLEVPGFNLRSTLQSLALAPNLADSKALNATALRFDAKASEQGLSIENLALQLDESMVSGRLEHLRDSTHTHFSVHADTLNIDRYTTRQGEQPARAVTPEVLAVGAMQLPLARLREANFEGDLSVGALQLSGLRLAKVSLDTRAAQGSLTLGPVKADLYGGRYQGAFALDARGKAPSLTIETALAKVAIAPLLADIGQGDGISGTLNFEARLAATGNSPKQQLASLSGPASFALTDGEINGIDLPAVLKAGERMLKSRKRDTAPKGGRTAFHSLTGSLRIDRGIVHNEDLLLDGVGFHVTGKGVMADLNHRRIDYRANLGVPLEDTAGKPASELVGFEIPVRCLGELAVSSCKADLAGLLGKAVQGVVNNGLGRKLKDEARGAGKALRKLLEF